MNNKEIITFLVNAIINIDCLDNDELKDIDFVKDRLEVHIEILVEDCNENIDADKFIKNNLDEILASCV